MNREERAALRKEMAELQAELRSSLEHLLSEFDSRLSPDEKEEIEEEIAEIDTLLERLKTGRVWLAIFGKASVGKSSVVNALMGADIADVGVEYDVTTAVKAYELGSADDSPYTIVDVPGVMGNPALEEQAIAEAKRAHGCVFVVDGEPYQDELDIFDLIANALPDAPRIVLCNKADLLEHMPSHHRDKVVERVRQKMAKYVESPDDIVFESAALYDRASNRMVRQRLTGLEDRLYDGAGTLGQIVNVFDPAGRATVALASAREKILDARRKVARKVIRGFALAEAGSSAIPFSDVVATPGLLFALTRSLAKIMGCDPDVHARRVTMDVLGVCAQVMTATFVLGTIGGTIADLFGPIGWILSFVGLAALKYQRTLIFGEAVLLYMENDFQFWNDRAAMIAEAKARAETHYRRFRDRKR